MCKISVSVIKVVYVFIEGGAARLWPLDCHSRYQASSNLVLSALYYLLVQPAQ